MALRALLSTILLTASVAACAGVQASVLGATCDEFGTTPAIRQSVEIPAGRDVSIALCSNPTTGYTWAVPTIGDRAVATVAATVYRAPDEASLPIVGRAGGQVVTLHAVAPGTTTLSMAYGQPWPGGAKGDWTYELAITVR
jgi:predicted secreted protein